ncbi:heme-binding protein 2-like [Anableps anableps]
MEKLLFTLVTLVLASSCSCRPSSCNVYPCPHYEVIETNEDFEERRYIDSDWVTTKMKNRDANSLMIGIKTLKAFGEKQKEAGRKYYDGWPALITIVEGDVPSTSLSWFLAPNPEAEITDSSITLEHKAPTTVYVRTYSGTPDPTTAEENKKILSEALVKAGKNFNPNISAGAHYESYFSLTHNNEIWIYSA